MKKLLAVFVMALIGVSCSNPTQINESFTATIFMESPSPSQYNQFTVIDSDYYDKPEINIDYSGFTGNKNKLENDTTTVVLEPFTSRFDTKRYRVIEILD